MRREDLVVGVGRGTDSLAGAEVRGRRSHPAGIGGDVAFVVGSGPAPLWCV